MSRNNTILKEDYEDLIKEIYECGRKGELPLRMELFTPGSTTVSKLNGLLRALIEDTGMDVAYDIYYCRECFDIHIELVISLPVIEDTGYPVQ